MQYRPIPSRSQGFLFTNIEDWISEDNPVRLLDLLLDLLYEKDPEKFHRDKPAAKGPGGRPAYHPLLFCKLYLYGYLNRINSSRRLEKECHRNMELMWLLSMEKPDFKTISNFRCEQGDLIRYCTLSFRRYLKEEGFIKMIAVALDGCRMKALAAKEGYTLDWVIQRIGSLEGDLDKYLKGLDEADLKEEKEESEEEQEKEAPLLLTDIESIQKEILRLEGLKEEMEKNSTKSHFPNDPDSRLMKGRYGSYPAYNVQGVMDEDSHMVVMAEVSNDPCDWNELEKSVKTIEEQMGQTPEVLLADKGYANKEEIKAVEEKYGSRCVIPLQEGEQMKKDRRYNLIFTYDSKRDVIICPRGKELTLKNPHYTNRHGTRSRLYRLEKATCEKCPKKDICQNTKRGRTYYLSEDEFIREYTFRSHSEEFKEEAGKRKAIIEHLFGTFRIWMGKNPFLLCGTRKVQTEIDLYASAYNFRRLLSLVPIRDLIKRLRDTLQKDIRQASSPISILFILLRGLYRPLYKLL